MPKLYQPSYTDKRTGKAKKLKKWYARIPFSDGRIRRVPFSKNKAASEIKLGQLLAKIELEKAGVVDPTECHRVRPLIEHLDEWRDELAATDATPKHVAQTVRNARLVLTGTNAVFAKDITEAAVRQSLAAIRAPSDKPAPELRKDEYTKRELAGLLGVGLASITALVKRHRLPAKGQGKARRYPKAAAAALLAKRGRGMGTKTVNQYLAAVKQFFAWMVRNKRLTSNPAENIAGGDPEKDRRVEFAILSAEELRRLIAAAFASAAIVRDLDGTARGALYLTASTTGFRPVELARLTVADFRLDDATPHVRLERTKNGETADQTVPADVAETLRDFLRGKEFDSPAWPGNWFQKAADLIRVDLDGAGLPHTKPGRDGRAQPVSFYSLRHSAGVLLESGGATLREVMTFMRHKDPKLTLRTYGRLQLADRGKTIEKMPRLIPDENDMCKNMSRHGQKHAQAGDDECGPVRTANETSPKQFALKLLEIKAIEDECGDMRTANANSSGRIRTYDPPVNSRLLYR
jgi:integrase